MRKHESMMKNLFKPIYFALRSIILGLMPKPEKGISPNKNSIRILVIRLDRIGDLVLSTPVFSMLRNSYPNAVIDALVKGNNADIISNNPNINNVFPYKGFSDSVASFRNKYDIVIDMLNGYELNTAILTRMINPNISVGFDVNSRGRFFTNPVIPSNEMKHFVEYIPDLLKPLNIAPGEAHAPEIFPQVNKLEVASAFLGHNNISKEHFLITIHPGSYYASQRWPVNNYKTLIELINSYIPVTKFLLLGSLSEANLLDGIYNKLKDEVKINTIKYARNDIGATVALISLSKLFVGNNSGLLHIATALKVPTVSFMGPTVPWLWHPLGPSGKNIVFRKDLPCSPCNKGMCANHECMSSITPEEVFDTLNKQLFSVLI